MSLPKVKFIKMDIEENINTLAWYAKPENSVGSPLNYQKFVLKLFPELDGKIKEGMSFKEIYMILDKEVRPILENLYKTSNDTLKFQEIWDKVNDSIMEDLEKRLNTKWNCSEIKCRLGLLPVCPRDILGKTFDINYGSDEDRIISTAIHELCHFIYFEKWMEIFPDYSEEEFDTPHIAWYLSEAMIDPLLNNEIFKKYTNDSLYSYSVFYETYIGSENIIDILKRNVDNYPIEEAIKMSYELFKNNEETIKRSR